jgi:hypothetical protein
VAAGTQEFSCFVALVKILCFAMNILVDCIFKILHSIYAVRLNCISFPAKLLPCRCNYELQL